MRVENFLQIRLPIYSKARNYCLGKGVTMYTNEVCDAMILFLIEQYEQNEKCCLIGDIRSLLNRKKAIDKKRFGDMTYHEHLQEQVRNGVYSLPKKDE